MTETILNPLGWDVAIPLGQGQIFNRRRYLFCRRITRRNPFGSGSGF